MVNYFNRQLVPDSYLYLGQLSYSLLKGFSLNTIPIVISTEFFCLTTCCQIPFVRGYYYLATLLKNPDAPQPKP